MAMPFDDLINFDTSLVEGGLQRLQRDGLQIVPIPGDGRCGPLSVYMGHYLLNLPLPPARLSEQAERMAADDLRQRVVAAMAPYVAELGARDMLETADGIMMNNVADYLERMKLVTAYFGAYVTVLRHGSDVAAACGAGLLVG